MNAVLKQLITDFHASSIPKPSPREFVLPSLPGKIRKAFIFIGMRRSGKTWSMYQEMHRLLDSGISMQKLLYINFEDDRLLPFTAGHFQNILDAYFELYPQNAESHDLNFFFDEIHEINGWEKFIRRLLDQENINIYISGSSSKMLGKEIASTLRGRTIIQEIFPFNFREYLNSKDILFRGRLTTKQKGMIAHHAGDFLIQGGFPETLFMDKKFHRNLLQGYIDVVIYRDIIERHKISNTSMVRELIHYCLHNAASLISINKLYQRFKSEGKTIGKNSLYDFIEYLSDAYCVFTIPLYTLSRHKQSVNPKKVYCVDQGFITAHSIKPEFDATARLENAVYCALRRETEEIFYYKTQNDKEVDFLILLPHGEKKLLQVCVSLSGPDTLNRELSALKQAMYELKINRGYIITTDEKKVFKTERGVIECRPAWEWLLF